MNRVIGQWLKGAAAFAAVALAAAAQAQSGDEVIQFSDPDFAYTRCYALTDAIPGPAAAFGEDVCVDYETMNLEAVLLYPTGVGPSDVEWTVSQQGTATVHARLDNAVLGSGFVVIKERGQDLGDDAQCLWSPVPGDVPDHASLSTCAAGIANLDGFSYSWDISGDLFYSFQVAGAAPGSWCGGDSRGEEFGPGCVISTP